MRAAEPGFSGRPGQLDGAYNKLLIKGWGCACDGGNCSKCHGARSFFKPKNNVGSSTTTAIINLSITAIQLIRFVVCPSTTVDN
jgi:hypothetical protein